MNKHNSLSGNLTTLLTGIMSYINLARFGHLPDAISLEKMNSSPHYKKRRFHNLHRTQQMTGNGGFFSIMWDFYFGSHPHTKPNQNIPALKTDLKALNKNDDLLIWFGHSSCYFQLGGKTFLVDPVFSCNASPLPHNVVPFKGTNIYTTDDIPEIDYLIITHDHYDHLDYETVTKLRPKIKNIVTGLGVGSHLRYWGYDNRIITELDWHESININSCGIYCLPARHFSGRLLSNRTLWASFLIEVGDYKLYIGGDSGYDDHYQTIGNRFKQIDLALLEAGQYDKNWRYIHEFPEEFMQAAQDIKAQKIIPIHNSKFSICNHPWYEPLDKIETLNRSIGLNILTPKIGEVIYLRASNQPFCQWWKELK